VKYLWPLLFVAVAVALGVSAIAHAASAPPVVARQFYRDNAKVIKALGGKAHLDPNVVCKTTPKRTIYSCTFKGTTFSGVPVCENYYIAYRPGYHTLPWPLGWRCGGTPTPLPPIPPLSRFHKISVTGNAAGA
jgi:hypothetical protein